jgi:DNA-binding winged helix-turn-helix (wHTH) protein
MTEVLRFGPFTFDPDRRLLSPDGVVTELGLRASDLLGALVAADGAAMSKADLMEAVKS